MKQLRTQTLVFLAVASLAATNTFQIVLRRSGLASDFSDFALGALMGVGIGLMGLAVWRLARERRV